jgi:hypothetical protein
MPMLPPSAPEVRLTPCCKLPAACASRAAHARTLAQRVALSPPDYRQVMAARSWRVLGLIAAEFLVGCGMSHPATLSISGEGGIGPVLSRADVRSARADVDPRTSQPVLLLKLTPSGQRKLLALVTRVAKAGRRRHHSLHLLISVNGKVINQQEIVYNQNGGPVPGPPKGIVVDAASIRAAHDLAATLSR